VEKILRLGLSGAATGAVYSLIASGLVLGFSTSGIFNFAYGAIAYSCALLYFELHSGVGWPILPSLLVTVLIWAPLLGLFLDLVMFRLLAKANEAARIVGTVGLMIAVPAFARFILERLIKDAKFDLKPLDVLATQIPGIGPYPAKQWTLTKGVPFSSDQLIILIAAAVVAGGLWLVTTRTRLGLQMRATVDRPALATLRGVDTNRTSSAAWILGLFITGLAGVIASPLAAFGVTNENNYNLLLIVAASAAVIGSLRSIPLAFLGGMVVGIAQNLANGYITDLPRILPSHWEISNYIPNLGSAVPFFLLFVFMFLLGRDRSRRATTVGGEVPPPDYLSDLPTWRKRLPWAIGTIFLTIYVTVLADSIWQTQVAKGLAFALIFLSFTIVTGQGGMVSLAQTAFVTSGALSTGFLMDRGWPFVPAVLVAAVGATVLGVLVALPSLRLGGLPLALATLALAFIGFQVLFQIYGYGGPANNQGTGWSIQRPKWGPIDLAKDSTFAIALLLLVGLVTWFVHNLQQSSTGRQMVAVRTADSAAATSGISPVRSKMAVFALSAFVAGLGGALLKAIDGRITFPDPGLHPTQGLVWLAVVVTFGIRRPGAAIVAGIVSQMFPRVIKFGFHIGTYHFSIFDVAGVFVGLSAIAALVGALAAARRREWTGLDRITVLKLLLPFAFLWPLFGIDGYPWEQLPLILFGFGAINLARNPDGVLAVTAQQNHEKRKRRLAARGPVLVSSQHQEHIEAVAAAQDASIEAQVDRDAAELVTTGVIRRTFTGWHPEGEAALELEAVRAGYGDTAVLHGVDLTVPRGTIVALLGANGAGKSTLCNVAAGAVPVRSGRIMLGGEDVTALPAHQRARQGIVLAPEQRGVFPSLSVQDNLELWVPSAASRDEIYQRFPILGQRRSTVAGSLSGGEQQMLTLAPLLANPPAVLVADEPSLGLAPLIVEQIIELFAELRDRGVSLLLVEEKARDVLKIADVVAFLELGHLVWMGPREDVDDEHLASSYLGTAPAHQV
jgi:ABC-type branched-subunit amino acid transport system ATPase component/branched-subunit amino acid ABC-type transport system permease component